MSTVLTIWFCVALVWFVLGFALFVLVFLATHRPDPRERAALSALARGVLLAPAWPLVIGYLLVRLWTTATTPDPTKETHS